MASEWRFEKGDRKSDSCSTEQSYLNQRLTKDTKRYYANCVRKLMKVEIMPLVIVANLHRIIKEGRITYVR